MPCWQLHMATHQFPNTANNGFLVPFQIRKMVRAEEMSHFLLSAQIRDLYMPGTSREPPTRGHIQEKCIMQLGPLFESKTAPSDPQKGTEYLVVPSLLYSQILSECPIWAEGWSDVFKHIQFHLLTARDFGGPSSPYHSQFIHSIACVC